MCYDSPQSADREGRGGRGDSRRGDLLVVLLQVSIALLSWRQPSCSSFSKGLHEALPL